MTKLHEQIRAWTELTYSIQNPEISMFITSVR